jgi:transposase
MDAARDALPDDIDALKAALIIERAKASEVAAELAVARAKASHDMALIAHQKLRIARLERQVYGQRSERSARLIDQLALAFEELEVGATEDELAAEAAVAKTITVAGFTRKRPERNTFPEHLPRERVVIDPPTACDCCGGNRLRKLGEDVTQTLESQPRRWKVIETVRAWAAKRTKVHLPRLREDHAGAGAVPCCAQRMGGSQPSGHDRV